MGADPRATGSAQDVPSDADILAEIEDLRPYDPTLLEIEEQTTYGEIILSDLVRRQLVLALSLAAVFIGLLFALPLVNALLPDIAEARVAGLPFRWLALAVLVYPVLWTLAAYYVSTSRKYEDEFAAMVR